MRKHIAVLLFGTMTTMALFSGCAGKNEATRQAEESEKDEREGNSEGDVTPVPQVTAAPVETVGILFPGEAGSGRWSQDAQAMERELEIAGYASDIRYAGNDESLQRTQVEELFGTDIVALVVDPVNPYGLSDLLDQAKEKSIPVISYDQLVMDTGILNYYITYDTRQIGHMAADKIVRDLDLEKCRKNGESLTIEFLMGSPDSVPELFFYNGVMEVLQPYIDEGVLRSLSGRLSFDDTAVMDGDPELAREVYEQIKAEFYGEAHPDIVCTASDAMALQVLSASGISEAVLPGAAAVQADETAGVETEEMPETTTEEPSLTATSEPAAGESTAAGTEKAEKAEKAGETEAESTETVTETTEKASEESTDTAEKTQKAAESSSGKTGKETAETDAKSRKGTAEETEITTEGAEAESGRKAAEKVSGKDTAQTTEEVSEDSTVQTTEEASEDSTVQTTEEVSENSTVLTTEVGSFTAEAAYAGDPEDMDIPYITGVGCTKEALGALAGGYIAESVFMDNRTLAAKCAEVISLYFSEDESPEISNYEQYDNGVKIIRTVTCEPLLVDASNYQMLIDNGYYSTEEVF